MKRFFAMLLCAAMLLSMSPLAYATAEEPTPTETPTPTEAPTPEPTAESTAEPSTEPTAEPTPTPSAEPTAEPTPEPTAEPTPEPTEEPTPEPTAEPTAEPTPEPTAEPTPTPTAEPTPTPTEEPAELLPVRVSFLCEPAELTLTLWEKSAKESETAETPAAPIAPQADGSWLLLPGDYVYSAECEGYEPVTLAPLCVSEAAEVVVTLAPSVALLGASNISNQGTCGENLTWTLDDAGTLTISGTGAMEDYSSPGNAPWDSDSYRIKKIIMTPGVTSIGNWAFDGCSSMTSVSIPESVTSIGDHAFWCCSSMTSVTIPNGVTSIGAQAFWCCRSLTSVTIPVSVTSIGYGVFDNCDALSDVYYSGTKVQWNAITSGGYYGGASNATIHFVGGMGSGSCGANGDNLTWTLSDDDVLTISGTGAMKNYSMSGDIPWNGGRSFIREIIIEPGVTSISDSAFFYFGVLTSVSIPESVTNIGWDAFGYSTALRDVYYGGTRAQWKAIAIEQGNAPLTGANIHCAKGVSASGECGDALSWTLHDDGVLEIVGTGAMTNYAAGATPWNSHKSAIHEVIIASGVTSIGNSAFSGCGALTSIDIPASITSIGASAFSGCTGLTSVSIPEGVTAIGGSAFSGCGKLAMADIPASVTSIGDYAFNGCTALRNVYYGGTSAQWSAVAIGGGNAPLTGAGIHCAGGALSGTCGGEYPDKDNLSWVLYDDGTLAISGAGEMANYSDFTETPWYSAREKIKALRIGSEVSSIGRYAFAYCTGLTSVSLPDGIATIGSNAFASCTRLARIDLPASLQEIYWQAFKDCGSLTSIAIPASVKRLAGFDGCTGLTRVEISDLAAWCKIEFEYNPLIYAHKLYVNGSLVTALAIPEGVKSISGGAFSGCSLTSVTIPEGVVSIGGSAFNECSSLTSVTLPEGLVTIGSGAFSGCSRLTSINIPNGITKIGDGTFRECSKLENITIPDSITSIGQGAFDGCRSLASVTVPEGVTSLGEGAFSFCENLTSVNLPQSLTSLGNYAFQACNSLKSVSIPRGVDRIGEGAFNACQNLTSVEIARGVTSIGMRAFQSCWRLTSVRIPETVTLIEEGAFNQCDALRNVYYGGMEPQWAEITIERYNDPLLKAKRHYTEPATSGTFGEGLSWAVDKNYVLTITGTGSMGENPAKEWGRYLPYLTKVVIGAGVTDIGANAFAGCEALTSVTIPTSVTKIGADAFFGCNALTSVRYPGSIDLWHSIEIGVGNDCLLAHYSPALPQGGSCGENLKWVLDKDGVLTITGSGPMGEGPTYPWSGYSPYITKLVIGDGVTDVGTEAFRDCAALTEAVLPDSVTEIKNNAFSGCSALEKIDLPAGLTGIGANAFAGCGALTSVAIPGSVTAIGAGAFDGCGALTELVYLGTAEEWSAVQLASGNEALAALVSFNPPASSLSITTADGEAVPPEVDMLALPELALKAALEPTECKSEIGWTASGDAASVDENGVVRFKNAGEVTISAKALDSKAVTAEVALSVYYGDRAAELTAETDRATSGMNKGETAALSVFGEDKETAIAPQKLRFSSDNEAVATVDENGVITATGAGTATVSAAFRGDDPLGRSVSIVVTVTPDGGAAGFKIDGAETAELHIEKADTARTLRLALVDAEGAELDITRFTLKSSDAKVTKVGKITNKKDANYGEYALTIPKNATGACTITATPKDKTLKGAETTLAVFVEDYAPRLGSTKLTLNSYQTAGVSTSLIPSYGNEIEDAIKVYEKTGKVYAGTESARLKASYADDTLTITTVDGGPIAKNQTINVQLAIPTEHGEQRVNMAVVVKNALPKVTVKQTQKKNLFYSDSEGVFTVTAKDAEIASMRYVIGGESYEGYDGMIAVSNTNGAKRGDLTVAFEGYNTPYVKKSLAFATVTSKPALTAAPTSGTISAEGDVDYAILNIYNKTAKQNLNLDEVSITATEGYSLSTSGEELMLMPDEALLNVAKKTARKVTLQIRGETWASPITVRYTLNIQPKKTLPTAKLGTGTLTLNLKYPEAVAETTLTLNQTNRSIDEAVFTCAKTSAIDVGYENGAVTARLNGGTVKAGSYSFIGTVTSAGETLKTVKLTVKVINSNASASVKASGKLDAVQRGTSGITYTVTVKNINGLIEDVRMLAPTGKLGKTVVDGSELFELETCGTDAKGQPKLRLTLKPDGEYSTKLTYRLRFSFMVNGSWVNTGNVSVKVTQSAIKVAAENAKQTVYQSQAKSKTLSYRIKLTSPADGKIGEIEIGKLNSAFRKSLADAASSISWDIAADGKSATVRVRINDTSKLVSGKTYTLPLVISGEGTAGGASAKLNLTLKAAK